MAGRWRDGGEMAGRRRAAGGQGYRASPREPGEGMQRLDPRYRSLLQEVGSRERRRTWRGVGPSGTDLLGAARASAGGPRAAPRDSVRWVAYLRGALQRGTGVFPRGE